MGKREQNFMVQVLDANSKAIRDALVILTSGKDEFRLECYNETGFYTYEKVIPAGEYQVTVSRKPFEEDSRRIVVRGSGLNVQGGLDGRGGKRGLVERSWQTEHMRIQPETGSER